MLKKHLQSFIDGPFFGHAISLFQVSFYPLTLGSIMTLRIAVSYLNLSILVLSQVASASLLLGLMIGGWFALNQITRIALVYNYQAKMRVHFS